MKTLWSSGSAPADSSAADSSAYSSANSPADSSANSPKAPSAESSNKPSAGSLDALRRAIGEFTAGNDRVLDHRLARWDILGSIAHVRMLRQTGILEPEEADRVLPALQELLKLADAGELRIAEGVEDIHSEIEFRLSETLGETGRRIHAARSRNDQVLTDLKLFLRHELLRLTRRTHRLAGILLELSETHKAHLLPGYTHMQVAMPSSFGMWFASWAECLGEDLWSAHAAMRMVNRNPLGSAAGYGSSFPIDREATTRELGFAEPVWNAVAAQLGRGRMERSVSNALAAIAFTLGKLSTDMVLYLSQNFGFIAFPPELTTGSSIMPHKKNPDVFELIRARCNRLQSLPNEFALLQANLPSGYHRDFQLFKEHLFPALDELESCLDMAIAMLPHVQVRPDLLADERYQMLFTVEAVAERVRAGAPFRDAYHAVGRQVASGTFSWDKPLDHTHQGSLGNLCNPQIAQMVQDVVSAIEAAAGPGHEQDRDQNPAQDPAAGA